MALQGAVPYRTRACSCSSEHALWPAHSSGPMQPPSRPPTRCDGPAAGTARTSHGWLGSSISSLTSRSSLPRSIELLEPLIPVQRRSGVRRAARSLPPQLDDQDLWRSVRSSPMQTANGPTGTGWAWPSSPPRADPRPASRPSIGSRSAAPSTMPTRRDAAGSTIASPRPTGSAPVRWSTRRARSIRPFASHLAAPSHASKKTVPNARHRPQ